MKHATTMLVLMVALMMLVHPDIRADDEIPERNVVRTIGNADGSEYVVVRRWQIGLRKHHRGFQPIRYAYGII